MSHGSHAVDRPGCGTRPGRADRLDSRDGGAPPAPGAGRGRWRFATLIAAGMALATLVVAWVYDLPVRDPDSVAGPTYLRLPLILLAAFLADVVPRTLLQWARRQQGPGGGPRGPGRSQTLGGLRAALVDVVRRRWALPHVRFALAGLAAWYVTYASFRNLKSFVPFVNGHLWDGPLDQLDQLLFLGHDPAELLHSWLGTGAAAHFFSFLYIAWIVFVPVSLVVALVWSRNAAAGAWYVTAVAVDWVLGATTYYLVPTLGPIYAQPQQFTDLPRTDVTGLQEMMMGERHDVLVNPFTTHAVQTIAAFASLHVGICMTMCVMAELLRLPRVVRVSLWLFLALTVPCTVYLGWHYFVDAIGGAVLGVAGVWIAGRGTGNAFRRRPVAEAVGSAQTR